MHNHLCWCIISDYCCYNIGISRLNRIPSSKEYQVRLHIRHSTRDSRDGWSWSYIGSIVFYGLL
ncbi:hypothetical protein Tsubulata_032808, partial [Turnera subulata]